jgi:ABC-2 type transport system permease protein
LTAFSCSYHNVAIWKKELRRYFVSPIAYPLLVGSGLLFGLGVYASDPALLSAPVFTLAAFPLRTRLRAYPRIALLVSLMRIVTIFMIPMITMRLFVEEKRSGTLEMLFPSPVRESEIVVGKFLGALPVRDIDYSVPG